MFSVVIPLSLNLLADLLAVSRGDLSVGVLVYNPELLGISQEWHLAAAGVSCWLDWGVQSVLLDVRGEEKWSSDELIA